MRRRGSTADAAGRGANTEVRETTGSTDYVRVMEGLRQAVRRRVVAYRALVIAVSLVIWGALLWALFARRFSPLLALLSLPAIVVLYFLADALIVRRWIADVMHRWQAGVVRIDAVREMLKGAPGLPQRTVNGMLGSLPSFDEPGDEPVTGPARAVLATGAMVVYTERTEQRLLIAALVAAVPIALAGAALRSRWLVILPLPALIVPLLRSIWQRFRYLRWHRKASALLPADPELLQLKPILLRIGLMEEEEQIPH